MSEEFSRKDLKDVVGKGRGGAKTPLAAAEAEVTPGVFGVSPDVLTLIDGLLVWDPQERLTAKDCLQSSYFNSSAPQMASFGSTSGETDMSPYSLNLTSDAGAEFAFEHHKMSFDELRGELLGEAKHYTQSADAAHAKPPALAMDAPAPACAPPEDPAFTTTLSPTTDSHFHQAEPSEGPNDTGAASNSQREVPEQVLQASGTTREGGARNLHWARGLCADFAPNDEHAAPNVDTNDPRRYANRLASAQSDPQVTEQVSACAIL